MSVEAPPFQSSPYDLEAGVEASLCEAEAASAPQNAQVSKAVLLSRVFETVGLLEYSRDPEAFEHALLTCVKLQPLREELTHHGFSADLPCGAKAFVRPGAFDASLEAVRLAGIQLCPRHILVEPSLEETVLRVVERGLAEGQGPKIKEKLKVRCKGRFDVPLGFAEAVLCMGEEVVISRTFIDVTVATSLRSASLSGPVTASTADMRRPASRNPRAA